MKGYSFVHLAVAAVVVTLISACAQITANRPMQFGYATVNVRTDSDDAPAVRVIGVQTEDGLARVTFPGDKPQIRHLYLRTGNYEFQVDCLRNWPHPPSDGTTYQLPHGLSLDDASEKVTVSVYAGKEYFLDCKPGLTKSEFIFGEDVWLAERRHHGQHMVAWYLSLVPRPGD